jgi:signal transduction histidine kinase
MRARRPSAGRLTVDPPPPLRARGSVRTRLIVTLWVPVLVLAGGAGWVITQEVPALTQARSAERMVALGPRLVGFDAALEQEARAALGAPGSDLGAAQQATDTALAGVLDELRPLARSLPRDLAARADELVASNGPARERLRAEIARGEVGAPQVVAEYARMRHEIAAIPALLARDLGDRGLARELDALAAVNTLAVDVSTQGMVVAAGETPGAPASDPTTAVVASRVAAAASDRSRLTAEALVAALPDPPDLPDPPSADATATAEDLEVYARSLRATSTVLADASRDVARAATRDAAATIVAVGLVAGAAVVVAAAVAPVLARRAMRPLVALAESTEERIAALPDQLRLIEEGGTVPEVARAVGHDPTADEIGMLSARVDELVVTTLRAAADQARLRAALNDALCTVAQREAGLVQRQLAVLDEAEQFEEDPVALDRLFRLDHLATQLRRTCDSLLVLGGARTARRSTPPMGLVDVVRSAASQIDQYTRVDLHAATDPLVRGHVTDDLIHLFAEVLDNATKFSQPQTRVEVHVSQDADSVIVRVRDHGIGLDPRALETIRHQLRSRAAESFDLGRLGMLVVGRLSARTGTRTAVAPAAVGAGTEVTTILPADVLEPAGTGLLGLPRRPATPVHYDESTGRPGASTLYGHLPSTPS